MVRQLWFCVVCPGDCVSHIGSYVEVRCGGKGTARQLCYANVCQVGACSVVESHGEENKLKGGLNCQRL